MRLNRAQASLACHRPKSTCSDANKVLDLLCDTKDQAEMRYKAKAYYRMGMAKRKLGDMETAMHFLEKARKLSPTDSSVGRAIADLDKYLYNQRENEKAFYKKMFGGNQVS